MRESSVLRSLIARVGVRRQKLERRRAEGCAAALDQMRLAIANDRAQAGGPEPRERFDT